jgi:hypothetical protein
MPPDSRCDACDFASSNLSVYIMFWLRNFCACICAHVFVASVVAMHSATAAECVLCSPGCYPLSSLPSAHSDQTAEISALLAALPQLHNPVRLTIHCLS